MVDHKDGWRVFIENREGVIAALERGECDGILPAARGFLDGFAGFLLEAGLLDLLARFPDGRQRRSIPIFFFCHTLIYRPLFGLKRLAPIERTLFRSPYILRQLGFNALQIDHGFYETPAGQHPFTAGAIAECFAEVEAADFLTHQKQLLVQMVAHCPGQFLSGLWVMDSLTVVVPKGAHTDAFSFKACILGVWQDEVVWPVLWALVPEHQNDCVVGQNLFAAAEEVLGRGFIRHLLVDRGFLDGVWITQLYQHGTRVTLGVRRDMRILEEMLNLSRLKDTVWERAEPPKLHQTPLPERYVTGFTHLQGEWINCQAPLSGCLIRDVYPDEVVYQGLVTTAPTIQPTEIQGDARQRWTLEEVFMTLTRYWQFDDLPPCREGVAYAMFHFALVAFTLLGLYLQETHTETPLERLLTAPPPFPLPEREIAVYAGAYFTLLRPSELVEIILTHMDAWQANQDRLLMALRLCEGKT